MTPQAGRWISTFLDAQAAEQDAARNTRLAYGRDLTDFTDWLAAQGSDLSRATRAEVENYLISCAARGLSKATRARRLSAIRQLYRFAHEEGWRADTPALKLTGPGRDKHLPGTLSVAEVEAARLVPSTGDVSVNGPGWPHGATASTLNVIVSPAVPTS